MDSHKDLIASLPPDIRTALARRSNRAGLWHLGLHLALIALLATGIVARVPLWWVLMLPLGIALTFLFTLEHECTHRTPFATGWLNAAVGFGCGLVLLLPFTWFRYFHMAHHKYTHQPGLDPELDGTPITTWRQWLAHVSGLPYWASQIRLLATLAMGRVQAPYLPARASRRMQAEAAVMIAAYGLALASLAFSPYALLLWIGPMLLGQPILRLYLLAEHGDCPHVASMLHNTRTTFTTAAMRFLAWNMPYHAEHHSLPNVPFYQLPRLHGLMRAHLGQTADGYAAFNRAYLTRRLGAKSPFTGARK